MTLALFISLTAFSFAMMITPGPNNLLLMTLGMTYGFQRTIPALMGTIIGVGLLLAISGIGVGALVMADPRAGFLLRLVGAGYLVYLAVRLWQAGEPAQIENRPPPGVIAVAAFQFVNPKAWMMTISVVALYAASAADYATRMALITVTFLVISIPCIVLWAGFGAGVRAMLKDPARRKIFNRTMSLLTLAAALLVFVWS